AHEHKLLVAGWARELGLPLTLNVVLHRANVDQVDALVALAERMGAERLELANAQYHGWALENRGSLLPSRESLERAYDAAARAKERLRGVLEVVFVKPDYFTGTPKACMDGWGRRFVHVAPNGDVLPCHAARSIHGMRFENARERALDVIWR